MPAGSEDFTILSTLQDIMIPFTAIHFTMVVVSPCQWDLVSACHSVTRIMDMDILPMVTAIPIMDMAILITDMAIPITDTVMAVITRAMDVVIMVMATYTILITGLYITARAVPLNRTGWLHHAHLLLRMHAAWVLQALRAQLPELRHMDAEVTLMAMV